MSLYSWEFTDYAVKLVANDVSEFSPRVIAKGVTKNSDRVDIVIHGLERSWHDGKVENEATRDAIILFMIYELIKSLDNGIDDEYILSEAEKFINKMQAKLKEE